MNQYQAILLAGTAGFSLLSASWFPFLILAGLEFVILPLVVGNQRLANALEMRKRAQLPSVAPSSTLISADGLDLEKKERFQELVRLTSAVERNYQRLSQESQTLLLSQKSKVDSILQTAVSHLRALQSYSELDRERHTEKDPAAEIMALEQRISDPATPPNVRERLQQTLEFKNRLFSTLQKSRENREALEADLETLETALRILAQESVGLTAAGEVAERLDDIVRKAEETGREIRDFERWAEDMRALRPRAGVDL